jgi:hypothetical protein
LLPFCLVFFSLLLRMFVDGFSFVGGMRAQGGLRSDEAPNDEANFWLVKREFDLAI